VKDQKPCVVQENSKLCLFCGKEKINDPKNEKKFCSKQCYWNATRKTEIRKCDYCNKEFAFQPAPSRLKDGKGKYCSKKCCNLDKIENMKGDKNPVYSKVTLICFQCKIEFDVKKSHANRDGNHFCSRQCKTKYQKEMKTCSGENNPFYGKRGELSYNWKGGKAVSWYDTYVDRLGFCEKERRDPNNYDYLQIACNYCGKFFNPSRQQVENRLLAINSIVSAENRFYCSESCKENCSIFNQHKYPKGYKKATSREVDPETRKETFKRDDWTCQRCGSTKSLHCHHIEGAVQQPMLANDPENCITLCKKCHKWVHSQKGCTTYDYRCK
jgi:hypothetical protein